MKKSLVALAALATLSLGSAVAYSSTSTYHAGGKSAVRERGGGEKPGKDKKFTPETPDNAKFLALKAAANKKKKLPGTNVTGSVSPNPVILQNKVGINDPNWYPPDWNGAIGGGRYLEVINNRVGFYDTSLNLLSSDTTFNLAGTADTYVGDPEIVYDPATQKFYYAMIDQDASGNWFIDYGFSKVRQPSSVADFCHYQQGYGTTLPDYPRLGGTKDFILIGTNNYANASSYVDSSVQWAKKPSAAALTSCPTGFATGIQGGEPFTPVPAHQTDPSSVGYILSSTWFGGSTISSQKVTKSATGTPVFSAATSYAVNPYSMPADVPQPGTSDLLSTFDDRLFQVVQSWDPRLNTGVLWTSNETFAGAGSGVQWYELTTNGAVAQQGVLSDSNLYIFNGTNAPDRAYTSSTKKNFGSNMGIDVNTGSASQYASMAIATKLGTSALSPLVTVTTGTGPITCGGTCRWGDRSSANAAIAASITLANGRFYFSNGWAANSYQSENVQVSP